MPTGGERRSATLRGMNAIRLPALSWGVAWALAASASVAQESPPARTADDAGQPRWELGLAAGGGRVADYPGADESHARGIVLPVFIYRGPVLRVDGGGIRGRVFDSPDWELDLSATAAFNARDNDARRGMPGLDYLFGVGPQLVYKGFRSRTGGPTVHLKTRAIFSTDFDRIDQRGATFDPELRWRFRPWSESRSTLTLSVQPTWASRALHAYFYDVDPAHATAVRPAYRARAGYLGTDLGATLSGRTTPTLSWFVTARAMSMHGAANAESPLMRDKLNLNVGAGIVWTPWQSRQLTP